MATQYVTEGKIVNSPEDTFNDPMLESQDSLEAFVLWKTQEWGDFAEAN